MTSVPSLNQIGRKLANLAHREIFGWLAGWLADWLANSDIWQFGHLDLKGNNRLYSKKKKNSKTYIETYI